MITARDLFAAVYMSRDIGALANVEDEALEEMTAELGKEAFEFADAMVKRRGRVDAPASSLEPRLAKLEELARVLELEDLARRKAGR